MSELWLGEGRSQALPKDKICLPLALENVKREFVFLNCLNSLAIRIWEKVGLDLGLLRLRAEYKCKHYYCPQIDYGYGSVWISLRCILVPEYSHTNMRSGA